MHREISRADEVFGQRSDVGLYLLTALLAGLLALDLGPLLLAGFGPDMAAYSWPRDFSGYRWALIAAVIGGVRTLYGSINSLLDGRIGADLALAIACLAAILINEPLVAAEIVLIGLVGECLESFTFHRTQSAIRKLAEVFPRRCWLLRDGREVRVFTHELRVGDHVVVKPGAKVPVDGTVIDGRSALDLSALTGESLPADRGPGDAVLAGAVNLTGALTIAATRVGDQTVAGRVIEITARALKDKLPAERTADRLARWFLPTVLFLAAATFGGYFLGFTRFATPRLDTAAAVRQSTYPALAVLVVACPCALILATPAAVIAALGRLAGTGVLLKSGAALERLARVRAIGFDKTGTLTEGRLFVGFVSDDETLRLAAIAERRSEHPIAAAILAEAVARGLNPEAPIEFRAEPGAGVIARTESHQIWVGTLRFVTGAGVSVSADLAATLADLESRGFTPLVVARDGTAVGAIGAGDRVRADAAAVVAQLRALGLEEIALISGDREAVARAVAQAVGIDRVHAGQLPTDKARIVGELPAPAAFVGDGVNDAPALATAAVGLAVGSGTDIAAEAGDVVLMGDPLRSLPLLVRLSRATTAVIRQNIIIFAFVVNFVGVAVTAWLWPWFAPSPEWYEASPLAAALYHQAGSLLVLLNSMRLLAFERGPSRRWAELRDRLRGVDAWIGRNLDPGEWLHEALHRPALTLFGVTTVSLAAWAASGWTAIGPGEVGLVRRFGRLLPDDLEPGLHWRWPWPVEAVARFAPDRVAALDIGYRRASSAALTWGSPHDVTAMADESEMATGDGNLVELQAAIAYRIDRPRVYLEEAADPEAQLRAAAEAVWREEIAGRVFADLLTRDRDGLQRSVFARLRPEAERLGLALVDVSVRDLHPPRDAVGSFHEVARSMEERDRQINLAEAVATRQRRDAASQGQRLVRQAEAEAVERRQLALAGRDGFFARLAARDAVPIEEQVRSATDCAVTGWPAIAAHLAAVDRARAVTDSRLAWEAIADALSRRDKVLIDADRLPGRRQLWLLDPELTRPSPRPTRDPAPEARR